MPAASQASEHDLGPASRRRVDDPVGVAVDHREQRLRVDAGAPVADDEPEPRPSRDDVRDQHAAEGGVVSFSQKRNVNGPGERPRGVSKTTS